MTSAANPYSTGGGGEQFESKVAAYYLSVMLARTSVRGLDAGPLTTVGFQTGPEDWLLDDLLLAVGSGGLVRRLALQVRSNFSPTASDKGFQEIRSKAWRLFLGQTPVQFDPSRDRMGIATGPLGSGVKGQLLELLGWAKSLHDPKIFFSRARQPRVSSAAKRGYLDLFSCPTDICGEQGPSEAQFHQFLRCLVVIDFDFHAPNSVSESECIERCQRLLEDPSPTKAQLLWQSLVAIAAEHKKNGGSLDCQSLLRLIPPDLRLNDLPDFSADWRQLREQSHALASLVPTRIGRTHVSRNKLLTELHVVATEHPVTVVLGEPGCGKSALLREFFEAQEAEADCIWFDAERLDQPGLQAWGRSLGLRNPMREILDAGTRPRLWLVVDRIDRFITERGIKCFAELVVAAGFRELGSHPSRRIIVSCRTEDWLSVSEALSSCDLSPREWYRFEVDSFSDTEVVTVLADHPALVPLWRLAHLRLLLRRPLFLRILADNAGALPAAQADLWIGEPHFVDWFWKEVVQRRGLRFDREAALLAIAHEQAISLRAAIPTIKVAPEPLPSLLSDRLCVEREGSVNFAHDVYGDWARLRLLLQEENRLAEFIAEIGSSLLLIRPLRLLALHLLEVRRDRDRWQELLQELHGPGEQPSQWYYATLEAIAFSGRPLELLRELQEPLLADNAKLLGQFLNRISFVAIVPDPQFSALLGNLEEELHSLMQAEQRFPLPQYWGPVLRYLHENRTAVAAMITGPVTRAVGLWLLKIPAELRLYRREAAEVAFAVVDRLRALEASEPRVIVDHQLRKEIYRNALASVDSLPNDVERFVRERCGSLVAKTNQTLPEQDLEVEPFVADVEDLGQREDHDLREVLMEAGSVNLSCYYRPELLRDALFAVLLYQPQARDPWRGRLLVDSLGIHDQVRWFPPFYGYGPFLTLLRAKPSIGLEVVLELVEHVTQRWQERSLRRGWGTPVPQIIRGNGQERHLWGDTQVFRWHRGASVAPHVVQVALMALEKWFYEELDAERSIDEHITWLLTHTSSAAIAGLLITVALRKPEKAEQWIESLMTCPALYHWDLARQLTDQTEVGFLAGLGFRQPEWLRQQLREWNNLPHRRDTFEGLVCRCLLTSKGLQERILPTIRGFPDNLPNEYEEQRTNESYCRETSERCRFIAARLDPVNYRATYQEGGVVRIEYVAPPDLQAIADAHRLATEIPQLLMTLPIRCLQLFEQGRAIPSQELENFWTTLQRIAEHYSSASEEEGPSRKEDSLCGGVAVLLRFHSDWLALHPERDAWCRQILLDILNQPPRPSTYDSPQTLCGWAWDRFAARAIPHLWAENHMSYELRNAACLLVGNPHEETAAIFFAELSTVRERLVDSYWQMLRFAVECGKERGGAWRSQEESQFEQWLHRRAAEFAAGNIPSDVLALRSVSQATESKRSERNTRPPARQQKVRGYKRPVELDMRTVQFAYSSLPGLSRCNTPGERSRVIGIWRDALHYSLSLLHEEGEEVDFDGLTDEWDRFLFARISDLIIELRKDEKPEEFWKPILELGERAHPWVEEFLRQWLHAGDRDPEPQARFCSRWQEMIRFALDAPNWQFPDYYYRWDLQEILSLLIGSDAKGVIQCNTEDWKPLSAVRDLLQEWVNRHGHRPRCFYGLILLLSKPGFSLLPIPGLQWLDQSLRQADPRVIWDRRGTARDLAILLDKLWSRRPASLTSSKEARTAFQNLLDSVATQQEPLALQLQSRIVSEL